MPRDPKRIKEVLAEVEKIWEKNPDLRFGQLICNMFNLRGGLFYIEDDVILKELKNER